MSFSRSLRFAVVLAAFLAGRPPSAELQWKLRYRGEPLPRYRAAMVFDAPRGETVLFGGAPGPGSETWVFDGAAWERLRPAHAPSAQQSPALTFDSARGGSVLFGRGESAGGAPETFEWNGSDWIERTPAVQPLARERAALVFDSARARSVLFGGHSAFVPRADTWEWDGTSWTLRSPATVPPARSLHGMAFDAARGRALLFGGFGSTSLLGDTWEWDGTDWAQRAPLASPPARSAFGMVYDSGRQRVVLFGGMVPGSGALGDTWEWDGTSWSLRTSAHSPPPTFEGMLAYDSARGVVQLYGGTTASGAPAGLWEWNGLDWHERSLGPVPRLGHALAHDNARDRSVLFGGFHDPALLADTWEWDGDRWVELAPAHSPEARLDAAIACDTARARVVLFGGVGPTGDLLADTWEWDGADWTQRSPATSPPARRNASMAFDSARRRVLLHGGNGGDFTPSLSDTWEWDGTSWVERPGAGAPPARNAHALAYDGRQQRVVLFGGDSCPPFSTCTALADTWLWNGTGWSPAPVAGPSPRTRHGAAFDSARSRTLVFGGLGGGVLGDLFEWDGTSWKQRASTGGPSPRYGTTLVYDPFPGCVRFFGGAEASSRVTAETWELVVPCDSPGPGHASGSLALGCTAEPRLGTSFCLSFTDPASSGVHLLLYALGPSPGPQPLSLGNLCGPGLLHLPRPFFRSTGTGNPAIYCSVLVNDPRIIGASFVFQGAVQETSGCWRLTDGLVLTVQP